MVHRKHIAVIAFPGYGHLIPLLDFAKKCADYHNVSFVISKSKLGDLKTRELFTEVDKTLINLVGLEDGIPDGLGEDTVPSVWDSMFDGIIPSVTRFIDSLPKATAKNPEVNFGSQTSADGSSKVAMPVDVVVSELFLAAGAAACASRGIPFYIFCTCSTGPFMSYLKINDATPAHENHAVFSSKEIDENGSKSVPARFKRLATSFGANIVAAYGLIFNSFSMIEKDSLEEMKRDDRLRNSDIRYIGPVLSEEKEEAKGSSKFQVKENVKTWLARQALGSVVYISFGSVRVPPKKRIALIGEALVSLKRPFIFSLRLEQHDLLPKELQAMMSRQFLDPEASGLILPWVPQKLILFHQATGVFLSHCGWNSSLESICAGKPVLAWPMFGDQQSNSEFLAQHGMGLVLPGSEGESEETVTPTEIAQKICEIAGWSEGESIGQSKYIDAAVAWKANAETAVSPTGSSHLDFVDLMQLTCTTR